MTTAELEPGATEEHAETSAHILEHHPQPYVYITVAVTLAIVTGIEVWTSYTTFSDGLKTLMLLIGMAIKFVFVAGYFMHLRFDSRIFRRFFITGIALAGTVYFVALLSLHVLIK
jgi:cytochrome c oxidase subunit 4